MGFKELSEKIFPRNPLNTGYEDDVMDEEMFEEEETQNNVHTSERAYASSGRNVNVVAGSSIEMKVVTPKSYDSVTQIADLLLSKKTVLLNLEFTNRETARRLIDFLSGVAYALGGGVQKVADNTYAITPSNVAVSKESIGAPQTAAAPQAEDNGADL